MTSEKDLSSKALTMRVFSINSELHRGEAPTHGSDQPHPSKTFQKMRVALVMIFNIRCDLAMDSEGEKYVTEEGFAKEG